MTCRFANKIYLAPINNDISDIRGKYNVGDATSLANGQGYE
jgi:hypothetical protein